MRKKEILSLIIFSFILTAMAMLSACVSNDFLDVQINDLKLQVEVADDEAAREQGLMNRKTLPRNQGMLFVFQDEERRIFWMKNTLIPLSIAFMNSEGIIIEIHDMEPNSTERIVSKYPARYALEVAAGVFSEHGIRIGDNMQVSLLDN